MKKILFLMVIALIFVGGTFIYIQFNYANVPFSALMSSDSRKAVQLSKKFMEDIQFKDFKTAASYSLPEQRGKYDIPELIERLFQVKPEALDINNVQVLSSEIDSTGDRARVKMKSDVKMLNTNEIRKPELMLYWKKVDNQWYMDLASSLK